MMATATTTTKRFREKIFKIGVWKVQKLYQAGKFNNVFLEMDRVDGQCLGLSEVKWPGASEFTKEQKHILYSGGTQHQYGVALILNKDFAISHIFLAKI